MIFPVILLAVMSVAALGQPQKGKEVMVTLCGRKLARAHDLVCWRLKQTDYEKRSISPNTALEEDNWSPEDEYLWNGRRDALNVRWGRNKRLVMGLADECCLKPCYTEEIESYC